uniref:Putative secreted peptide n=1 Tax=Anopheles braziliensis TaxID=58242 RepID=A0A2M3ZQ85_9DIPT
MKIIFCVKLPHLQPVVMVVVVVSLAAAVPVLPRRRLLRTKSLLVPLPKERPCMAAAEVDCFRINAALKGPLLLPTTTS